MPSPTMATVCPSSRSRWITSTLPSGSISATAESMPTCAATASAAARLSPVSRIVRSPRLRSAATAAAAESLRVSAIVRAARTTPSTDTKTTVSPRDSPSRRADTRAASWQGVVRVIQDGLPTST